MAVVWDIVNAVGINNDGLILADAEDSAGNNHSLLLVPMALAVDNNRDGIISFDDSDKTTPTTPYRFWLNDDQDESTSKLQWTEKDPEIYEDPPRHRDADDHIINSPRDCEDLTRIWLDAGGILKLIQDHSRNLYLGLKWRSFGNSTPSIRLFLCADTNGGLGHIKDATIAAKQADPAHSFSSCLADDDGGHLDQVRPTGRPADFIFTKNTFGDLIKSDSRLHLLFEGVTEGKGRLCLVLLAKNHDGSWISLGEDSGIWLDLQNIRRMYLRAHSKPLPEQFPLPWENAAITHPPAFPYNENTFTFGSGSLFIPDENLGFGLGDSTPVDENQLDYPFEPMPDEQKKCVVFVHGIDLDVPSQQGYAQTFYKRLWWEGYRGRFASFRWATTLDEGLGFLKPFADRENTSIYNSGEYRSWKGGISLKKYVGFLRTQLGDDEIISVAGHSLGNACVGEALRKGMKVESYVAMEAAVPLSCYFAESESPPTVLGLVAAESNNPTPQYAHELGYHGYLSDIGKSTSHRVSYFNPLDFWLMTGQASGKFLQKPVDWVGNQLDHKPDDRYGFGQYEYNSVLGNLRRPSFSRGALYARWVDDPHEVMAFVSRSRTIPFGAGKPPSDFGNVNLIRQFGFGNARSDHSGQFQRNIQLMYGDSDGSPWVDKNGNPDSFYSQLMRDLNIEPR